VAGARVVVTAHLGRPKGAPEPKYSLAPVAKRLSELLDKDVAFATDTVGESARKTVASLNDGDVALLENVRFDARETSKDDAERGALADELAELADYFVSDGFGVVHRKQASVYDIAQRLPRAAGRLVEAEFEAFRSVLSTPQRPYVVVLGGSKVSDKLGVIDNLLGKVNRLLIGGGMAFTFLAARGYEVGGSLLESDQIETVRRYLERAAQRGVELVLPIDVVVSADISADAETSVVEASAIPADQKGLDIGPATVELFRGKLADARTVVWNGPMGVFELPPFAAGTTDEVVESVLEGFRLGSAGRPITIGMTTAWAVSRVTRQAALCVVPSKTRYPSGCANGRRLHGRTQGRSVPFESGGAAAGRVGTPTRGASTSAPAQPACRSCSKSANGKQPFALALDNAVRNP
jgi:phosphoglycerate kinase